jgi:hypothetical protein
MPFIQDTKYGFYYWLSDDGTISPAALYDPLTGLPFSSLTTSPAASDVVHPRSITFTLPGSPSVTVNVVEDNGNLDFHLTALGADLSGLGADLSGLFFDFTPSKLLSLSVSGPDITQFLTRADGIINLPDGVNLDGLGLPNFDVGMEFGVFGVDSNRQNIQSESFVLSDSAHNLSIDDLHPSGETGTVGVRTFSVEQNGVEQKLAAVAPYAPTATPDTVTTPEDVPIPINVSKLATDLNSGAVLTIARSAPALRDRNTAR